MKKRSYDRDYESAGQMYWSLGVLNITADDVYGGEPAELGIEEMVSENLVSLNLKQIAILGDMKEKIYTYLEKPIDARVEAIVGGIEESMGKARGKAERVSKYLAEFPRHRAFKQEMKAYM